MAPRKSHNYLTANDEESLIALRHYELEAYSAVVTALRAEGKINDNKKSILKDLREILGISVERHKAEIRRAANDETLSKLAKQIQGVPCDDDWQSEGSRIVGILQRSLPITAYTKIADRVAENLVKENNALLDQNNRSNKSSEKPDHEKIIHPPVNPQQTLNNKIFEETRKDSEEHNTTAAEEESDEPTKRDFLDSYVFLPGGTVVKLERNSKHGKTATYDVASGSNLRDAFKKIENAPTSTAAKTEVETVLEPDKAKTEKKPGDISDVTKRSFPFKEESHEETNVVYSKVPKRHEYSSTRTSSHRLDHLYSTNNSQRSFSHSQPSDTSWTSKHNVAAEAKSKKRIQRSSASSSRKLGKTQPSPLRRSPSDKRARITGAGYPAVHHSTSNNSASQQHLPPQPSSHQAIIPHHTPPRPQHQASSRYHKTALEQTNISPPYHSVAIYPKPTSSYQPISQSCHRSLDESMFRSEFSPDYQQINSSPQRVFRPTMQMTSPLEKSNAFSPSNIFSSTSPTFSHCQVEAGLAPVSAIMSQVSSQDAPATSNLSAIIPQPTIPISSHVTPVCEGLSNVQSAKSPIGSNNQQHVEQPSNVALGLHKHREKAHILSSQSTVSAVKKKTEPTDVLKRLPTNLIPAVIQSSNEAIALSKSLKEADTQAIIAATIEPAIEPSQAQVETTETSAKPSVLGPRPITSIASPQLSGSSKPALTAANIIKVTPRPLIGSKGIVTQLAGARITKAFGGTGSTKPSIIVVRQAPRKTLTAPVKEGDGNVPRVISASTVGNPSLKSSTIIRSVTAKVSVRDSAAAASSSVHELPAGAGGMHKVITKGKMRQLVLKPTSSSILRHTSQEPSALLSSIPSQAFADLGTSLEEARERLPTSTALTGFTMKTQSSVQKGDPQSAESTRSTFSHVVANKSP